MLYKQGDVERARGHARRRVARRGDDGLDALNSVAGREPLSRSAATLDAQIRRRRLRDTLAEPRAALRTAESAAARRRPRARVGARRARRRSSRGCADSSGSRRRRSTRSQAAAQRVERKSDEIQAAASVGRRPRAADVDPGAGTRLHGGEPDADRLLDRLLAPRPDRDRAAVGLGRRRRRPVGDPARHPADDPRLRRGRGRGHRRRGRGERRSTSGSRRSRRRAPGAAGR